jgi:hypothetical protein
VYVFAYPTGHTRTDIPHKSVRPSLLLPSLLMLLLPLLPPLI